MKLSKKKKNLLHHVCQDVFLKFINDEHPDTIDNPPDMWNDEEKKAWDLWGVSNI